MQLYCSRELNEWAIINKNFNNCIFYSFSLDPHLYLFKAKKHEERRNLLDDIGDAHGRLSPTDEFHCHATDVHAYNSLNNQRVKRHEILKRGNEETKKKVGKIKFILSCSSSSSTSSWHAIPSRHWHKKTGYHHYLTPLYQVIFLIHHSLS